MRQNPFLSYKALFKEPVLETPDGASYKIVSSESPIQIVPLVERQILEILKHLNLVEDRLPRYAPFQVAIMAEQDDRGYAMKALNFIVDMKAARS